MRGILQGQGGKTLEAMTSDATATTADILTGKTAYSGGEKLTGTAKLMKTKAQITRQNQYIPYIFGISSFDGVKIVLETTNTGSQKERIEITLS